MEEDGRDHRNCFNGLINQVNKLDDTSDVLLEAKRLMKHGSGDSTDGRALVVDDARDFVDGYIVMLKNDGLKVTIRVLVILKIGRAR